VLITRSGLMGLRERDEMVMKREGGEFLEVGKERERIFLGVGIENDVVVVCYITSFKTSEVLFRFLYNNFLF